MQDRRGVPSYLEAFRQLGVDVNDRQQMRELENDLRWLKDARGRQTRLEAERDLERRDRKSRLWGWGLSLLSTICGGAITWILAHGSITSSLTK